MRTVGRIAMWVCLVVVVLADLTYITDDLLWSRFRRRPVEQIKVGRVYADVDHWNHLEYSIGTSIMETCADALMPHSGYTPCWYLKRHTIRTIGP